MDLSESMSAKITLVIIAASAGLAVIMALLRSPSGPSVREPPPPNPNISSKPVDSPPEPVTTPPLIASSRSIHSSKQNTAMRSAPSDTALATNRLERLKQLRASFQLLAASNATNALRMAKQLTNETERESALLTLAAEWTGGDLRSPRERAHDIDLYGIEAGLGMELAKNPELTVLWANELTDGPGRAALLAQTAIGMLESDPTSALALSQQLSPSDKAKFNEAVFAGWAQRDTEAAIQLADQLSDPAEQDAAMQAIRSVAPVGIGAALSVQNGYPVVNQLLPGTPAELSGQIHVGDRILAVAQGDNSFVDARNLTLAEVVQKIRGLPGTVLQLQVQSADSPPQTISIVRDQIKFKR